MKGCLVILAILGLAAASLISVSCAYAHAAELRARPALASLVILAASVGGMLAIGKSI